MAPPRRILAAFAAALLLVLAFASPASAVSPILRDCIDGVIDGRYTQEQFQRALAEIPADVDEYTDCRDVVRRAQLAAAGRGRGGSGAALAPRGPAPPLDPAGIIAIATPTERKAIVGLRQGAGPPVEVGGVVVDPGAGEFTPEPIRNPVPPSIVALLLALALGAAATLATSIGPRVFRRRT